MGTMLGLSLVELVWILILSSPFTVPVLFGMYAIHHRRFSLRMFLGFVTIEALLLGLVNFLLRNTWQ
jgi:hypothetical protein